MCFVTHTAYGINYTVQIIAFNVPLEDITLTSADITLNRSKKYPFLQFYKKCPPLMYVLMFKFQTDCYNC